MKTLELENYGVTEMSNNEMKEVDGGLIFIFFIIAAAIGYAAGLAIGEGMFNNNKS